MKWGMKWGMEKARYSLQTLHKLGWSLFTSL